MSTPTSLPADKLHVGQYVGFLELTPINERGQQTGPKISFSANHILRVTSAYRPGREPSWDQRQKRFVGGQRPIGSAIRQSDGRVFLVREYYQRVLWLLYRARREMVVNYDDKRDKMEFQVWAHEHLGWQLPDWIGEFDDRNYVHPNDLAVEALAEEIDPETGLVTFSDGTRGIPASDNTGRDTDVIFRMPVAHVDSDGNYVSI